MIVRMQSSGQQKSLGWDRGFQALFAPLDRFTAVPPSDLHLMRMPAGPRTARPSDPPPLPSISTPMAVERDSGGNAT